MTLHTVCQGDTHRTCLDPALMDALCSHCCELQLVATGHLRVVSRLSQLLYWQGLYWRPERDWAVDAGQEEMKQSPRASPGWTVKNIILGPTQARWDSTRVWSPYVKVYGPRRESRMTQKVKTLCLLLPVTCIQNIRHSLSSHPLQPISDASSGPCSLHIAPRSLHSGRYCLPGAE